jgi:predicted RNA-binding Zn ribbon-like protein
MTIEITAPASPVLFIGDNLALDFLNTTYGVGEERCDHLTTDASVIDWLKQADALAEDDGLPPLKGLLKAALELREAGRVLVQNRKSGKWADPTQLNQVLLHGSRYPELQWKRGDTPSIIRRQKDKSHAAVLLPVAEALAKLLTEVDFNLVRECECDTCTLWFHDHTKSHRRRWCSMAVCGNRMKVAAYRSRQKN